MNRQTIVVALVCVLLTSTFTVEVNLSFVSANFMPEQDPAGIHIKSDGTVEGTDKILQNGNIYTFTDDIYVTILVEKNGITLDGAGFTLQGNGNSSGLFLRERDNVAIRNLTIEGWNCGVNFAWASYGFPAQPRKNTLQDCVVRDNYVGIRLGDFSDGTLISGNVIANNTYAFNNYAYADAISVFKRNTLRGNQYSIGDYSGNLNDIDTSNTIDGKPIYYWYNQHDKIVPSDASLVILKNCFNITVQGLSLSKNVGSIILYNTTNSVIAGNSLTNNIDGIALRYSSNNTIIRNAIRRNAGYGIYITSSSNNNITDGNIVTTNGKSGIYVGYSSSNHDISHNYVGSNAENGIDIEGAGSCQIVKNNATANGNAGIKIAYAGGACTISGNYIAKNAVGIYFENPYSSDTNGHVITENTLIENNGFGMRLDPNIANSQIYRNNFIRNNVTDGLQVSNPLLWGSGVFQTARANNWDKVAQGNYWSDYLTRYKNASEIGNTGTGNTAFFINENNIDHYPLMTPVTFQDVPSAIEEEPAPAPTSSPQPHSTATPTLSPEPTTSPTLSPTPSPCPTQTSETIVSPSIEPTTEPTNNTESESSTGFQSNASPNNYVIAAIAVTVSVLVLVAGVTIWKRMHNEKKMKQLREK